MITPSNYKPTLLRQVLRTGFYRDVITCKMFSCNKVRWKTFQRKRHFKTGTLLKNYWWSCFMCRPRRWIFSRQCILKLFWTFAFNPLITEQIARALLPVIKCSSYAAKHLSANEENIRHRVRFYKWRSGFFVWKQISAFRYQSTISLVKHL